MLDLHPVVGSPEGAWQEVPWKSGPRGAQRGEVGARKGENCGGPRHEDLTGGEGAAAVFSL